MSAKRVLVLGASGMVGQQILQEARGAESIEMLAASHRHRPGYVRVDYDALTTPQAWVHVLQEHRIDAVVNCVGIWSGTPETFERVQYTVPVALFDACSQLQLRVIHISALGFQTDSILPYASTKARADRYLLAHCPTGVVIYPSLVFGSGGDSSRFFLHLAALPVQVDFGFARNLQPVHVCEVVQAVVYALRHPNPPHTVDCAGTHAISIPEYFDALRKGMGLRLQPLKLRVPTWCGRLLFAAGEWMGAQFINRQTWILLQTGTRSDRPHPAALPYSQFATPMDLQQVRQTQLYWFARLGIAFLWLWTAMVTYFAWPRSETLSWLQNVGPGLGTSSWLTASCALDAGMGMASLLWPRQRLWIFQFGLTLAYSVVLAVALPWSWSHPLGPLTKNLAVMATMLFLSLEETRRGR